MQPVEVHEFSPFPLTITLAAVEKGIYSRLGICQSQPKFLKYVEILTDNTTGTCFEMKAQISLSEILRDGT